MTSNTQDQWAQWLLHRRFGGDHQHGQTMLKELSVWRDRILEHATITEGETVLDVGCGDGLIAFGALDRVGEEGLVIFSDLSQDLLDHCRSLAEQMQVLDRCRFVRAPADDLAAVAPGSVDVVTTRSVLIYVQAKQQALHEFFRVLKPGGRLSIFEPINRFCYPEPAHRFLGYDVTPIEEIAGKVRAVFERIHEPASSPLLNFDERDFSPPQAAEIHPQRLGVRSFTPCLLKRCSSYAKLKQSSNLSDEEPVTGMAKATTTIRQTLNHKREHGAWFAANQALFNRVAAFYFEVIQAHEQVLELGNQEALTALEQLTHATKNNPHVVMPLASIAEDIPAMFRRAAIHAALGAARSFQVHLKKWRTRKEQVLAKGKKFTERPPVPPRSWNKSVTCYAGLWKERNTHSIMLKIWTGSCWSWVKCRITGRELPADAEMGSPQLVRHGKQWWLHTPVEKQSARPAKVEEQVTTNAQTKICAIDLNVGEQIACCTIQTAEGSILATRFIGGGNAVSGFRKKQLGRVARNRSETGLLALGEQDNGALWRKITHRDDDFAHQVSRRIVQFAREQGASILVFEYLGNLKPEKGRYSHRGNVKRAFWMKGRIFRYAKYKAYNEGGIITCRVNPKKTSRECARCGGQVVRYAQGQPEVGYQVGAPLVVCPACQMRGHADRNASLKIGQRLIARYQPDTQKNALEEKPLAPRLAERSVKAEGVIGSQDARGEEQPSLAPAGHGTGNGHGTAQIGKRRRMGTPSLSIPPTLRLPLE